MRFSKLFCPTLKETPKDAEVVSHQYMARAGMIRKLGSGIYAYLPLGWRSMQKMSQIIREEMNRISSQETQMPTIIPKELFEKTGRWDKYGHLLLRMRDRHDNEFCYGPTHEESITDVFSSFLQSYKQLPLSVYQIQPKFRDEFRPRFGLMRGREFVMKDAYSFHDSYDCLTNHYEEMRDAYKKIFSRCNLNFKVVHADSGEIGGSGSAEFMVTAETGEDLIVECNSCEFASNLEAAPADQYDGVSPEVTTHPMSEFHTPGAAKITDVATFLNIPESKTLKTLIYMADEKPVMVLIRGDFQLNEVKLKNLLRVTILELVDDETFVTITGTIPGYAGPINLKQKIRIIADHSIKTIGTMCVGANKRDYHLINVVMGRDFETPEFFDLRNVNEGEVCQTCKSGKYRHIRGIEVGHIFKLGDVYSSAMKATYLNEQGQETPFIMGCYGIGVGRTLAAAIEQNHDEKGIKWPVAIAPYTVNVMVINPKEQALFDKAESLYQALEKEGIDCLFDDRPVMAGVKFNDADLIGFPVQVIVGKGFEKKGLVEIKWRMTGEVWEVAPEQVIQKVKELIQ